MQKLPQGAPCGEEVNTLHKGNGFENNLHTDDHVSKSLIIKNVIDLFQESMRLNLDEYKKQDMRKLLNENFERLQPFIMAKLICKDSVFIRALLDKHPKSPFNKNQTMNIDPESLIEWVMTRLNKSERRLLVREVGSSTSDFFTKFLSQKGSQSYYQTFLSLLYQFLS
jgi:hypothetical protein